MEILYNTFIIVYINKEMTPSGVEREVSIC